MPTTMPDSAKLSRRNFLTVGLAAAAAVLIRSSEALKLGWIATAEASSVDEVRDTLNALLAFILPGPDEYSVAQGVSSAEPGGIAAGVTDVLIETIDQSAAYLPGFSAVVATAFNDLAGLVNPIATGSFASQFAHLTFAEKVASSRSWIPRMR